MKWADFIAHNGFYYAAIRSGEDGGRTKVSDTLYDDPKAALQAARIELAEKKALELLESRSRHIENLPAATYIARDDGFAPAIRDTDGGRTMIDHTIYDTRESATTAAQIFMDHAESSKHRPVYHLWFMFIVITLLAILVLLAVPDKSLYITPGEAQKMDTGQLDEIPKTFHLMPRRPLPIPPVGITPPSPSD